MARYAAVSLAAAWMAAGIASFEPVSPVWLGVLGVLALLTVAAVWAGAGCASSALLVPGLAAASVISLLIWPPTAFVATDAHLAPAMIAAFSAPAAVLFLPLVSGRAARASVVAVLALLAVGYSLVIWGGTPVIDVWVLLQDSARGLLHGANPYQMMFPGVPRGQDSTCFTYWPGTFLVTAPGNWVLGDVRWAEAGYLLAAVALAAWSAGRCSGRPEPGRPALAAGLALAAAIGIIPGTALVVLQAWTEPILLLGLVGAAVLIDRHPNWAVLPLGLALASKQYMLIMVPLLAFWPRFGWRRVLATGAVAAMVALPWLLLSLQRFQQCTIGYFLREPTPLTSLSLWRYLPEPLRLPLTVAATALTVYVAIRRCPRNGAGFLLAAGTTLMMFNAVNKETFTNQWWLAAALITASFALQPPDPRIGGHRLYAGCFYPKAVRNAITVCDS